MVKNHQLNHKKLTIPIGSPIHQLLMPIIYFEIFNYPLKLEEILQFNHNKSASLTTLKKNLTKLVEDGYLFNYQDYYLSQDCPEWITIRKEHNERAANFMKRAKWMTKIIKQFPFVRAVILSGSLSKNVMPKDGDIDYFIITQPNRLWISRTFLILFKKIFLLNFRKYFCVNYFIDEQHLEIEEKNRFTATEIITLIPLYNSPLFYHFLNANDWVDSYYPNFSRQNSLDTSAETDGWVKRAIEKVLNHRIFDRLDAFFMKKTIQYWNKKFQLVNPIEFSVALKSRRYVSKHHPKDFQNKVRKTYERNLQSFEKRNDVKLERIGEWIIKNT